jgi:hypothetical protein
MLAMKVIRFSSLTLAILSLCGWWATRRPASPTDELPPVWYAAFELSDDAARKGEALTAEVRTWEGITAANFNPKSSLLTVSAQATLSESTVLNRLRTAAGPQIEHKVFSPTGPQCPVPASLLAHLPGYFLVAGLFLGGISLLTLLSKRQFDLKKKKTHLNFNI